MEHTQFSCSLWVSPPAASLLLSCSPLSHRISSGEPVYVGRRALQWELILAKCGLYQLDGEQGLLCLGCIVCLLLLVGQTVYSSPCSFIPCWGIIHGLHLWQEQPNQWGGRRFQREKVVTVLFHNAKSAMFLCPFLNSRIEKSSLIPSQSSPSILRDLGIFMSI